MAGSTSTPLLVDLMLLYTYVDRQSALSTAKVDARDPQ
ncbi:hypothetical protein RTCIAT899_PB00515 (plasmid) [Rhizobium tropici CIAT 899]|nr:hypothetical protein RTCIAT899_PB00515 [Rhizobium tropici CIAT 899]